ncbi:MAG: UbiA family prenyltransferase [Chloroflexaceae bacterium]|nr:UbiA family prenyltransferase [Chloroflexaceae bacterium]
MAAILRKHRTNIMFEHTIFALPFAYLGLFLAAGGWPGWWPFFWVTLAMVGARTAAMSFNRVIDARIDAANQRTAYRPIPSGQLDQRSVLVVACGGLGLMLLAAWQLNPLCVALSPLAVVALTGYSFTKRFTWASHFILGLTDAMAPAGGWLAVQPEFTAPMLLLSLAVGIWIAGFDIIYACQDVDFDRQYGLYSIPACFGVPTALRIAQICHLLMVGTLVVLGLTLQMGWLYGAGVVTAAGLLFYEHRLIAPHDMSKIDRAFFTVNSYVAGVLFLFTLADLLL